MSNHASDEAPAPYSDLFQSAIAQAEAEIAREAEERRNRQVERDRLQPLYDALCIANRWATDETTGACDLAEINKRANTVGRLLRKLGLSGEIDGCVKPSSDTKYDQAGRLVAAYIISAGQQDEAALLPSTRYLFEYRNAWFEFNVRQTVLLKFYATLLARVAGMMPDPDYLPLKEAKTPAADTGAGDDDQLKDCESEKTSPPAKDDRPDKNVSKDPVGDSIRAVVAEEFAKKNRTKEGAQSASPPPRLKEEQITVARTMLLAGEMTQGEIAKFIGVGRTTMRSWPELAPTFEKIEHRKEEAKKNLRKNNPHGRKRPATDEDDDDD